MSGRHSNAPSSVLTDGSQETATTASDRGATRAAPSAGTDLLCNSSKGREVGPLSQERVLPAQPRDRFSLIRDESHSTKGSPTILYTVRRVQKSLVHTQALTAEATT